MKGLKTKDIVTVMACATKCDDPIQMSDKFLQKCFPTRRDDKHKPGLEQQATMFTAWWTIYRFAVAIIALELLFILSCGASLALLRVGGHSVGPELCHLQRRGNKTVSNKYYSVRKFPPLLLRFRLFCVRRVNPKRRFALKSSSIIEENRREQYLFLGSSAFHG